MCSADTGARSSEQALPQAQRISLEAVLIQWVENFPESKERFKAIINLVTALSLRGYKKMNPRIRLNTSQSVFGFRKLFSASHDQLKCNKNGVTGPTDDKKNHVMCGEQNISRNIKK